MAMIFSADARVNADPVTLPDGTLTEVVRTVALPVPFVTAKAKVVGVVQVALGITATDMQAVITRNPESEAEVVAVMAFQIDVGVVASFSFTIAGVDEIPSSRDVVYQLVVRSVGDASTAVTSYLEAMLISG